MYRSPLKITDEQKKNYRKINFRAYFDMVTASLITHYGFNTFNPFKAVYNAL